MKNSTPPARDEQTEVLVLADQAERDAALDTTRSFLVQAPAGSGKTELLIRRFLKLLAEVDEPEQVLAITFTRAATAEMRSRLLDALEAAHLTTTRQDDPLLAAAFAALANSQARGWKLLEQPQRLNIQTIDSLCLNIAHRTPLLSRLGGSLSPVEDAEPLYALAAHRTLARLGGDREDLSQAIRGLLETRDTRLSDCESLIAGMLARRDQWGQVLNLVRESNWQALQTRLEAPFRLERQRGIARARTLLARDAGIADELLELAAYACSKLEDHPTHNRRLLPVKGITKLEELGETEHWNCICDLLLTGGNAWRKSIDKNLGFPPDSKKEKERFRKMMATLQAVPGALDLLCELRELPPPGYSREQWQLLKQILLILRYAAAELRVLFAQRGAVDFVELGLGARQALRGDEESDALPPAQRWRHLLVDEFQDTSRGQYELLTLLIEQWESPGTCFLVGDPMQSIYAFRQAEVELFERTRHHGLGNELHLEPLLLQTNFRSQAGLVNPLNAIFTDIFAQAAAADNYKVAFARSVASKIAPEGVEGLRIAAQFLSSQPTPQEKDASNEAEAEEAVRVIRRARAENQNQEDFRIAVLARARKHLTLIAQKLREAGIPFRAVEIEGLSERQEVLDLASLTRSLLHPMDRIAWLSVLRAPWCGLTLKDLHILCGSDDQQLAKKPLLSLLRQRIGLLSLDGQERASRVAGILEQALRGTHRQVSLSSWVERVWRSLGGRECVDPAGYENARAFFRMLEELPPGSAGFDQSLGRLFAEPDPQTNQRSGVQLMTIHKAKGLGFDLVLVPGLHRSARNHEQPLLNWLERTMLEGAGETEQRELLVAPIGRKGGDTDPLYCWIARQKEHKEREESKRLLYVASTRAKRELHLLATVEVKMENEGGESLTPGRGRSLLKTAWSALESRLLVQWKQASVSAQNPLSLAVPAPGSPPRGAGVAGQVLQLRRLPADWKPFAIEERTATVAIPQEESSSTMPGGFERPGGSLKARALGHVVHALLEEVTASLLKNSPLDLLERVDSWRPRARILLRQAGLARTETEAQSALAVEALKSALEDEIGCWILAPRAVAGSETSWSVWTESGETGEPLSTLRADRIFRAGAKPGSEGETHTWIVDYKTARHGSQGLDAFLEKERAKYRDQLESYATVMRKIDGDDLSLRLALYYPLLKKLVWWED